MQLRQHLGLSRVVLAHAHVDQGALRGAVVHAHAGVRLIDVRGGEDRLRASRPQLVQGRLTPVAAFRQASPALAAQHAFTVVVHAVDRVLAAAPGRGTHTHAQIQPVRSADGGL